MAALSLAAALLMTGCGQGAGTTPDASTASAEQSVEPDETAESEAELVTEVPEEYKASAEAGEGWIQPNGAGEETDPILAGNFILTLRASSNGDTVLVGVNANTGETTIETELPGSVTFGADVFPEIVQYGGQAYFTASHQFIPEEDDGLSKAEDLMRKHFVELTDGAEAVHYDVAPTEDGLEDLVTPEGPIEGSSELIATGYLNDGGLIVQEGIPDDFNEGVEDVWDLHLGQWTVPKDSFSASVETGFMAQPQGPGVQANHGDVVFFSVNDDLYVADAESKQVIALPEDAEAGEGIKTSPDGRYVTNGVGDLVVDLESGTVHDLRETDDREAVTALAVTDTGVVYGTTYQADIRYDTATGEFTALDDGELMLNVWDITPEGTLVGETIVDPNSTASIQGVRMP
ncbi:hypothetical protein LG293_17590 (plasmid) [Citricoccus nitrophenolicus]